MVNGSIAIIPARGGSKRIPRKNVRPFLGRPILAYSIDAALAARLFDEVMVSTDDTEIAELAKRIGASVPFLRSAKSSDDHASTADVLIEVCDRYREQGRCFSHYCCIYPTAPFVTPEKLRTASRLLAAEDALSVMPVVRFSYPIQRALAVEGGWTRMIQPENIAARSQDLPVRYHDAGQFYFGRIDALYAAGSMLTERTLAIVMPETEVQDIDHEDDWQLAEIKYRLLAERSR